jgi:predicted transcriptional regulator
MNNEIPGYYRPSKRVLVLSATEEDLPRLESVSRALASQTRLAILRYLGNHTSSVLEIAEALDLPPSTAAQHINVLEQSGLIETDLRPATRGLQKVCARIFDDVVIQIPKERPSDESLIEVSVPIGSYVDAVVSPTCGLASASAIIGHLDDPGAFFEPERLQTQLIWFRRGYVEYRLPNRLPPDAEPESLEVSFEVCSEAPLHHADWPSDITVWINGVELGSWTSPGDFGGERGALTPTWWGANNTQFGLLKVWRVNRQSAFIDGVYLSPVTLADLHLEGASSITVRIGVKADAHNVGGINLFGREFGNYPQDIVMRQRFRRSGRG